MVVCAVVVALFVSNRRSGCRRFDAQGASPTDCLHQPHFLEQDTNAAVQFGPNGDVSLYRVAADTLQTDGNLVVGGMSCSVANL